MPDGRPKSTDYCTGVSDVRELQINLMVHLTLFWTGSGRTLYWMGGFKKAPTPG